LAKVQRVKAKAKEKAKVKVREKLTVVRKMKLLKLNH
jgi:hypothetical protein